MRNEISQELYENGMVGPVPYVFLRKQVKR